VTHRADTRAVGAAVGHRARGVAFNTGLMLSALRLPSTLELRPFPAQLALGDVGHGHLEGPAEVPRESRAARLTPPQSDFPPRCCRMPVVAWRHVRRPWGLGRHISPHAVPAAWLASGKPRQEEPPSREPFGVPVKSNGRGQPLATSEVHFNQEKARNDVRESKINPRDSRKTGRAQDDA
jgi:hypothetical protein